jgi:DHA1 family florfenicol/chloramphenicol resistance protein-like MFS transporter
MRVNRKLTNILLLAPFIVTFSFGLDIYLPSIPSIHAYFNTTERAVQWTISIYLLFTGIGQLVVGPIADRYGRKIVIVSGSFLFLLGCLVSIFSNSIIMLILSRFIQGIGACSMMVATFALVRDLYSGDEVGQIYSCLNAGVGLSPAIAPIIGGYLAKLYDWRAGFVFLAILGFLVALLALVKLKETLTPANSSKISMSLWRDYLFLVKDAKFLMYTYAASAGFACLLTFFSVASYILISRLHIPEQNFGYYFAVFGAAYFVGGITSGYIVKKIGVYFVVLIGASLITVAGIIMLLWHFYGGLSVAGFLIPVVIMTFGATFVMGGGAGGAIEPFPKIAGRASAVFGASEFVFAFIISTIVLQWKVRSTYALSVTLIVLGFVALSACLSVYKRCRRPLEHNH